MGTIDVGPSLHDRFLASFATLFSNKSVVALDCLERTKVVISLARKWF